MFPVGMEVDAVSDSGSEGKFVCFSSEKQFNGAEFDHDMIFFKNIMNK